MLHSAHSHTNTTHQNTMSGPRSIERDIEKSQRQRRGRGIEMFGCSGGSGPSMMPAEVKGEGGKGGCGGERGTHGESWACIVM